MAPRSQTLPAAATESAREARKAFFCQLCNKGYSRSNELEAHQNSYDHTHRQRLMDMKALTRDPNAAARAREAASRDAVMKPISTSTDKPATKKKPPVFKSTLQPHNVGLIGSTKQADSTVTDDLEYDPDKPTPYRDYVIVKIPRSAGGPAPGEWEDEDDLSGPRFRMELK